MSNQDFFFQISGSDKNGVEAENEMFLMTSKKEILLTSF
jgi:hypothetical protein